jgi:hypothetical protein
MGIIPRVHGRNDVKNEKVVPVCANKYYGEGEEQFCVFFINAIDGNGIVCHVACTYPNTLTIQNCR